MQAATHQGILKSQPVEIHLEFGNSFAGLGWGDFRKARSGEFVFCTAMTGLEESLTDPSFAHQVVVSTVAHVGNTGFTNEDAESSKVWAEGLICRHLEALPSNWRSKMNVAQWLCGENRFVVEGVDTREFTTVLREQGSQRGIVVPAGFFKEARQARSYIDSHVAKMDGLNLTELVSCKESYNFSEARGEVPTIAVWDFGVKTNTLRTLAKLGAKVVVMPATSSAEDLLRVGRDGILLSNGPGDPAAATHIVAELKKILGRRRVFAICLGHQLVALAAGLKTYKMKFGHRGIHHPVVELDSSGKALRTWITSQNHGFAVDAQKLAADIQVSFVHADDGSVEGLSLANQLCRTVQFHPEAAPGPTDAAGLLSKFYEEVAADLRYRKTTS